MLFVNDGLVDTDSALLLLTKLFKLFLLIEMKLIYDI